jgi:hypothetical protein
MLASMSRPASNIAISNLNPKNKTTRFINERGEIEELLPFNVGSFIKEIENN